MLMGTCSPRKPFLNLIIKQMEFTIMKYLRLLSRLIVGMVFIFSGFVKAVDPLGSAYKFADYFTAFKLGFLEFLALPMGVLLSAFELVLGIVLILGYRRKIVSGTDVVYVLFYPSDPDSGTV